MSVFKKINRQDIIFVLIVAVVTALCMMLPSKLGTKGTSPGYTALNAILLTGNCTDIIYEKYEKTAADVLETSLRNDLDDSGMKLWGAFIREKYSK